MCVINGSFSHHMPSVVRVSCALVRITFWHSVVTFFVCTHTHTLPLNERKSAVYRQTLAFWCGPFSKQCVRLIARMQFAFIYKNRFHSRRSTNLTLLPDSVHLSEKSRIPYIFVLLHWLLCMSAISNHKSRLNSNKQTKVEEEMK